MTNVLHELKVLVQSMHPVVLMQTIEEERVDDLLRALAAELKLPLFTWTVTRGLQRVDGTGMIFRIHLRLRRQDPAAFDVAALAQAADGFSGAEIEQAVIAGLYKSLHDKTPLTTALLLEEIGQTSPLSVVRREDITRLRETARGRFVPVK